MIFRGKDHEKLFNHESRLRPGVDNRFTAALYLLTADNRLWAQVRDQVTMRDIDVGSMRPHNLYACTYVLFQMAKDIVLGTDTVSMASLVCPAVISERDFLVICSALAIRGFGMAGADRLFPKKVEK